MKTPQELRASIAERAVNDEAFRSSLLADPKAALAMELGVKLPEGFDVEVHEEDGTKAHIVLPPSSRLSEADLSAAAGGDAPPGFQRVRYGDDWR